MPAADAYAYVGFENLYRGSRDEIRSRLTEYLPLFAGASDVLDVGCGRGEFLDLLRERDVRARGVDVNAEMVEECRRRGLDASAGDALTLLDALEDESLGGLFAAQVVEHLQPDYLVHLLNVAAASSGPAPGSSWRPSIPAAGSPSSTPTSATSPTCARCTRTR